MSKNKMDQEEHFYRLKISDSATGIKPELEIPVIKTRENFKKVILDSKDTLSRYNVQASIFYKDITTDKQSPDNRYGGYFNISTGLKYATFRIFIFLVLQWMEGDLSFSDKINGIIFNIKNKIAYVQVWVNDGFKYEVLKERYEELTDIIINRLKCKNEGFSPAIEFFPHQNYRDQSPSKTYAYKVKPFGQFLEEISPDILSIPKEAKFNMDVATTHKIPWSLRREKQSPTLKIIV